MQGALVDGKGEMWHSLAHHTIMFSLLADKLDNTFRRLRGLGKISEKNIADALRDIRLALLEADVEFGVAREFIGRVKERAMGQEVPESHPQLELNPSNPLVKKLSALRTENPELAQMVADQIANTALLRAGMLDDPAVLAQSSQALMEQLLLK